ncbi:MAG: hypothetical protein JSU86_02930 [Phycisphaerales bacterium]|nr:MAG: hypothetical protein JSU86_02930 [Phycisphaerales bacterium]
MARGRNTPDGQLDLGFNRGDDKRLDLSSLETWLWDGHQAQRQPYLISIGDRAEQIAHDFEQRQITAPQALEAVEQLIGELRDAESERDATGLSPEAYAVFHLLKRGGIADSKKVAEDAKKAFAEYPHWRASARQEQDVRRLLYKSLIDAGVEGEVDVATQLIKLLRRASS